MRLIFYIFLISQFLNFLGVFAEKIKGDSSQSNSVNWEKVNVDESIPLNEIIWKSYENDQFYFENKNKRDSKTNSKKSTKPTS